MITQIRTCDSCKTVIPHDRYDFNKTIKVHIGHYDNTGTKLEFCDTCWNTKYRPHSARIPGEPIESVEQRAFNLLTELINLLPIENQD